MDAAQLDVMGFRTRWFKFLLATVSFLLVILLLPSCDAPAPVPDPGDNDDPPPTARASDCIGCHTQEALLKEVARDEPPPAADTGEG